MIKKFNEYILNESDSKTFDLDEYVESLMKIACDKVRENASDYTYALDLEDDEEDSVREMSDKEIIETLLENDEDNILYSEEGIEVGIFNTNDYRGDHYDEPLAGVRFSIDLDILTEYDLFRDKENYETSDYIYVTNDGHVYVYFGDDSETYLISQNRLNSVDRKRVYDSIVNNKFVKTHTKDSLHKLSPVKNNTYIQTGNTNKGSYERAKELALDYCRTHHTSIDYETDSHIYCKDGHSFRID